MSLENLCIMWAKCHGNRDECRNDYEACSKFWEYLEEEMGQAYRKLDKLEEDIS